MNCLSRAYTKARKKRKRGSITDLPFIMGGILALAIVALLTTLVVQKLDDQVQDNTVFNSNAKDASTTMRDDIPNVMNGGIVFIFFGAVFISFVLAALVPIHPAFFIFYIFEWFILIWLGGAIANIYQDMAESAVLFTVASQFLLTEHFFRYFPFVTAVVGIILAIVMYKAKKSFVGE